MSDETRLSDIIPADGEGEFLDAVREKLESMENVDDLESAAMLVAHEHSEYEVSNLSDDGSDDEGTFIAKGMMTSDVRIIGPDGSTAASIVDVEEIGNGNGGNGGDDEEAADADDHHDDGDDEGAADADDGNGDGEGDADADDHHDDGDDEEEDEGDEGVPAGGAPDRSSNDSGGSGLPIIGRFLG